MSLPTGSRRPQGTLLHRIVSECLPLLIAMRLQIGRALPQFVIREFNAFLQCGDIRAGFAELGCTRPECPHRRKVPLCCKGRGWCPYCGLRRLWDRSGFLQHEIFGNTPVRHWVLTLPPPIRFWAAFDPSLATDLLTAYIDAVFGHLQRKAKRILRLKSMKLAYPGSVTTIQRFSSDLSLNFHFHSVITDGVFVQITPGGPVTFLPLSPPTRRELAEIAWKVCRRAMGMLKRRGLWVEGTDPAKPTSRPTVYGTVKKARKPVRFCGAAARHEIETEVIHDGAYAFNLCARQGVDGGDHEKLAKVIRYILNPPFRDDQLVELPDGRLEYTFKRPHRDGTEKRVFTKMQLMRKLILQTPRPNVNLIRFHGAYAPKCKLRAAAVAVPLEASDPATPDGANNDEDLMAWSEYRRRTHPDDAYPCPICGSPVKLIALHTARRTYRRSGVPPDTPGTNIALAQAA